MLTLMASSSPRSPARKRAAPPLTKLAPPSSHSTLLARPGVLAAVCTLAEKKLAVVIAPTGSGKSTLLAQAYVALAAQGMEVCWLSLDASDNTPQRFVANLVAALQRARPGVGAEALDLLAAASAIDEVLASLLNDLTAGEAPLTVFLDDYQAIDNPEIHAALSYFLQYSPASLHMAIASQREPQLTITRLKTRNAVVELGFDDLKLDAAEIRDYLAQVSHVRLSEAQIEALAAQTEGWICGLQLATIAIAQRGAAQLPEAVAGGAPAATPVAAHFADYLLEEIYARQSPEIQRFLSHTSMLTQFNAPLAAALTGAPDAAALIANLERANLFIIRLDAERVWFRYHHLFSGFLKSRLQQQDAALARELNRRAARWYQQQGQHAEALRYANAAQDSALAVDLLEVHGRQLLREGNFKELAQWLEALAPSAVQRSAVLCVLEAWTHLYVGVPVAASSAIRAGEAALGANAQDARLRDELQILRTMCGVTRYDLPEVAGLNPGIAESFSVEEPLQRAYAHVVLGYAARLAGKPDEARRRYEEGMRISELNEDLVVNLMARYNVAMVDYLQARPQRACEELAHWLNDARNRHWRRAGSAGFLNAARAMMLLEMDRLPEALAEASEAINLLATTRTYAYVGIALALRAQIRLAMGEVEAVEADLAQAREIGHAQQLDRALFRAALVAARAACRTQQWDAMQEELAAARAILEQSGQTAMALETENHAAYHAVQAECLLAQGRIEKLLALAGESLAQARRAGRVRYEIEFLMWSSLALQGLQRESQAAANFGRAIDLAAGSSVIKPFVAGGAAVLKLLEPHRAGGLRTAFAARIAQALERGTQAEAVTVMAPPARAAVLHQRETQILQLLGLGLRNKEIGARLFISEETVKWYLKNIFGTLGVGNRTHALIKAREMGLLS
jgi:LuxR family maltose regulon positive regulatory protein